MRSLFRHKDSISSISKKRRTLKRKLQKKAKNPRNVLFPTRTNPRPLGFLRKLFGSKKYEVATENVENNSNNVSTISYKKHNMDFLENHDITGRVTEFHPENVFAPESVTLNNNKKLVNSVGKLLTDTRAKDTVPSNSRIELMNVIEKTFTQQLDIFKGLLDMAESNTLERNICRKMQRLEQEGKKVDDFLKDLVRKLVLQLHQDTANGNLNSDKATFCQSDTVSAVVPSSSMASEHVRENTPTREIEIECECNIVAEFGNAVSAVDSREYLIKNHSFDLE